MMEPSSWSAAALSSMPVLAPCDVISSPPRPVGFSTAALLLLPSQLTQKMPLEAALAPKSSRPGQSESAPSDTPPPAVVSCTYRLRWPPMASGADCGRRSGLAAMQRTADVLRSRREGVDRRARRALQVGTRDDHRLHALAGRDHQARHGGLLHEVGAGGKVIERVLAVGVAGGRADQRVVAAGILPSKTPSPPSRQRLTVILASRRIIAVRPLPVGSS